MPATGTSKFADHPQYPLNTNRQQAALEHSRTLFYGATGLVGTTMSRVPMVATRVQTGVYRFTHPPSPNLAIVAAHVEGPSGTYYDARIKGPRFAMSGTFEAHISGGTGASVAHGPANPPTGAALCITYMDAPKDLDPPRFRAPKLSY